MYPSYIWYRICSSYGQCFGELHSSKRTKWSWQWDHYKILMKQLKKCSKSSIFLDCRHLLNCFLNIIGLWMNWKLHCQFSALDGWICGLEGPILSPVLLFHAVPLMLHSPENEIVRGKCGAAPLTRRAYNTILKSESNNVSTHFLLHNGYVGNAFKDTIKKVSRKSVTVWHSTERIEKIQ